MKLMFTDECVELPSIANAHITYNMELFNETFILPNSTVVFAEGPNGTITTLVPNGTLAMITCDDGYRLEGSSHRTCVIGNWTNEEPTCVESESVNSYFTPFS